MYKKQGVAIAIKVAAVTCPQNRYPLIPFPTLSLPVFPMPAKDAASPSASPRQTGLPHLFLYDGREIRKSSSVSRETKSVSETKTIY